jgi:hypothetical protein
MGTNKTFTRAALALLGVLGCACAPDSTNQPGSAIETVENALSSNENCGGGTPAATINGNGIVRSSTEYNPSDCFRGYKVAINAYAPGEMGTLIAYGSPAPTTAEECGRTSLRVYAFRKNATGTGTFIDNVIKRGSWVSDGFGGMRCATPYLDVTASQPTWLTRGGNFQIASRASVLPPAGSTVEVYKQVLVSIPPHMASPTLADMMNSAATLGAAIASPGSGPIHAEVNRLFNLRGAPPAVLGSLCRSWEIETSLYRENAVSLKKIVPAAQAALVDSRTTSAETIRSIICDGGFPSASTLGELQGAVKEHLLWSGAMQTQIMSFLNVSAPEAAQLISESAMLDLRKLASRCGAVPAEMAAYVTSGTKPGGMAGPDVLLRNCTGTPVQIATGAGLGANTGGDARTKFRACMDKMAASATDRCAGPRSSKAEGADPNNNPADHDGDCGAGQTFNADTDKCEAIDESTAAKGKEMTPEQIKTYVEALDDYEESNHRSFTLKAGAAIMAVATAGLALSGVLFPPAAPILEAVAKETAFAAAVALAGALAFDAKADKERHTVCAVDPDNAICPGRPQNKCVEFDLSGDKAWFQTAPDQFFPDGAQTTQADQLDDCLCQPATTAR